MDLILLGIALAIGVVAIRWLYFEQKRDVDEIRAAVREADITALRDEVARQSRIILTQYAEISTLRACVERAKNKEGKS